MPAEKPVDILAGNSRYKEIKFLNSGSFGAVILAEDTISKEQVAIKFVQIKYVCATCLFIRHLSTVLIPVDAAVILCITANPPPSPLLPSLSSFSFLSYG